MKKMTLNEAVTSLFPNFKAIDAGNRTLQNLQIDSRLVQQDDLFIGVIGYEVDGRNYVKNAIEKGAIAILIECERESENLQTSLIDGVPCVKIYEIQERLSELGDNFYDHPSQKQFVTAVTGTNGKTTISQLTAQWMQLLGNKAAVLGTIGNGILGELEYSENTTISAIDIQHKLATYLERGVKLTAMEASSHGLVQGRTRKVAFDVVAFTNLTHEHLDYHHNMHEYEKAKWILFSEYDAPHKVINIDDEVGYRWWKNLPNSVAVAVERPLPADCKGPFIYASDICFDEHGTHFKINSSWGEARVSSRLIGLFNVSNLLVAMASLLSLGFEFSQLVSKLPELKPICGRMEWFAKAGKPVVVVDYAHTHDAMEKALLAVRNHCNGQLWCVFGSGGERDKLKRPKMGYIAEVLADKLVITDDNPRMEPSMDIINQIVEGLKKPELAKIIVNRADAIRYAISEAKPNDIILIAGKGHEEYQVIGVERIAYCERQAVTEMLGITL